MNRNIVLGLCLISLGIGMMVMISHYRSRTEKCFTQQELELIYGQDSIMRVLTIDNPADAFILRNICIDICEDDLFGEDYNQLARRMVETVKHPSQDGVGIAGPQIGLNRRIVAVQRFDKEPVTTDGKTDYPFEVYPNIRIVWASETKTLGSEGCLSVPARRGDVIRSDSIVVEYASPRPENIGPFSGDRCCNEKVEIVRDTISGFTAVIFQHEIDHLDGVLYIDKAVK